MICQRWDRRHYTCRTVAKGPQADDKFIERAVRDIEGKGEVKRILEAAVAKALRAG